jgi:hypothetical protein
MSRVNAFMSRATLRSAGIDPPPVVAKQEERFPLDPLHGLHLEQRKRRIILKATFDRGEELVGKRVAVRLPITDMDTAVLVRDCVFDFFAALGVRINRRPKRRERGDA